MANPWIAALCALFVWWFSTGAILWAVKRADRAGGKAHLLTTLLCVPVLVAGWVGLVLSLGQETLGAVYLAFISAVAIWGWFELAFLCGVITGPNTYECPKGVSEWERFIRAWGTVAYSEIALTVTLIVIISLSWQQPNAFGMWVFAILYFARISAKLNVFLGVPNINVEFLSNPMRHLASHFKIGRVNWFFPIGVFFLTLAFGCWLERAVAQPPGDAAMTGFALLAALTLLAIVEHWVMILPIPDEKLWRWMMPNSTPRPTAKPTIQKIRLSEDIS